MIHIVDVSHHNGVLDPAKLKATGYCDAEVIRICHGTTMDKKFLTNLAAAKANGIPYAFYWYAEAATIAGAQAEAKFVLSKIAGTKPLFVAYDAECRELSAQSKNATTDIANAALMLIKAAGFSPYFYTNENWRVNEIDTTFLRNKGYGFWYARYNGTPLSVNRSSMCDIWQYSSTTNLPGNGSSAIDLNVVYNVALIQKIAGGVVSPTWCDTTQAITIKQGKTYVMASGSKNITTGDSAIIETAGQTLKDGKYFTTLKAVGRVGQGAGVFLSGVKKFVATIG